ncbi:MAG: hypothetical protein ACLTZW_04690 [Paratractidigestivibacter faecalis]
MPQDSTPRSLLFLILKSPGRFAPIMAVTMWSPSSKFCAPQGSAERGLRRRRRLVADGTWQTHVVEQGGLLRPAVTTLVVGADLLDSLALGAGADELGDEAGGSSGTSTLLSPRIKCALEQPFCCGNLWGAG